MINLIALTGKAHSGKSSLADMLSKALRWPHYAFASPIKHTVNELFGWDGRHAEGELKEVVDPRWGFTPRRAYQLFGTEFGRAMRADLWLKYAEEMTRDFAKIHGGVIITDCRFDNEAEWVRRQGGLLVHVRRDGQFGIDSAHASEQGIAFREDDFVTNYCKDLRELEKHVPEIVSIVKQGREHV
jgi:hypothetical protein